MNLEDFKRFISKQKWICAKTYSDTAPHEYCLKDNTKYKKEFEEAVIFIRENGIKEYFYKKEFIYFYCDGYKYWTMGAPVNETILINRTNNFKKYKRYNL